MAEKILFIVVGVLAISYWLAHRHYSQKANELGRFKNKKSTLFGKIVEVMNSISSDLAERKKGTTTVGHHPSQSQTEAEKKLVDAGLETSEEQGKFFIIRAICFILGPVLGSFSFAYFIPYYATITTIITTIVGFASPFLWLKYRSSRRIEELQRELPLVLDLTNLGTSAGWDVASALEKVIDGLSEEYVDHPLIRELRKARWATVSGYTWSESLERMGNRLDDDMVRRSALALAQAIHQGGDRTRQLDGIASDAQRMYNAQLDKRLAALPVKALMVTMMLMVSYFIILLIPAILQIKNTIGIG